MRNRLVLTIAIALLAAGTAAATGGADPTSAVELAGPVLAYTASSGSGMPMLTVDDAVLGAADVALGPVWVLRQAGFSAEVGDQVELVAFACTSCAAPLVAAWVDNLSNGSSVVLRDEDGRPVWTARQQRRGGSARPGQGGGGGAGSGGSGGSGSGGGEPGGSGSGSGSGPGEPGGGGGLDMTQVATVTGEVADFTGPGGPDEPILALVADGETFLITVSPYQPIAAAGLVIEPGLVLTVTFAPTECVAEPHLVTIAVTDVATGLTIQLRDPETGFPMAPGGGHNRPQWP
ncbi:MAG: hypothetical protein MUC56_17590 [Thermoanaerobaculales bacterium]|nr:hypothetical protein [Thermoanaerobaculales bacterium]